MLASAHCSYPDVSATFSWAFLWCCNSRKRNGLCFLVPLTVILFFVFLSFFPCMLCSLLLLLRRRFDVVEGRCSWGRFVVGGSLVFFLLRFFVIVSLYHPGVRLPSKNGDSHWLFFNFQTFSFFFSLLLSSITAIIVACTVVHIFLFSSKSVNVCLPRYKGGSSEQVSLIYKTLSSSLTFFLSRGGGEGFLSVGRAVDHRHKSATFFHPCFFSIHLECSSFFGYNEFFCHVLF